jgi:peptidoglycan hydrolase-like protein with peptidoglycan-binding domain
MPFVNAVGTVADYAEAVVVPTPKESMEFKEGGRSPLIAKFQQILKDLKFFPADTETTGYYGTITKEAYAKFVANTGFTLSPAPTGKGAETDIMDMETKSLFRSRTFWFAVATFVAGVLTLANETFKDVLTPEMAGALLMAVSVINGALRLMTHTAVR